LEEEGEEEEEGGRTGGGVRVGDRKGRRGPSIYKMREDCGFGLFSGRVAGNDE